MSLNCRIHLLTGSGVYSTVLLGRPVDETGSLTTEAVPQYMIPAGTWLASELGKANQSIKSINESIFGVIKNCK